ncbi:hypothetical protein ACFFRR_011665 [Megaselia abdita]
MFHVQGKNVVIVGGLNGVGLSLTKTLLSKRVNKLFIIDVTENITLLQDLRVQFQTTKINFERIDYLNLKVGEIQNIIQTIVMKMQYIDVFINALEMVVEKDLQRTMDINMKLYLNMMLLVRNVMDRNKGGRGGLIVNLLSNLGLQTLGLNKLDIGFDVQQYLINKQMLLSLTKSFSDEIFFQQTGVMVMSVMPVINQKLVLMNIDWIKKIGLQNLVVGLNLVRGQKSLIGNSDLLGLDLLDQDLLKTNQLIDQDLLNVRGLLSDDLVYGEHLGGINVGAQGLLSDDLVYGERLGGINSQVLLTDDLVYGQRLGGVTGNIRKLMDLLSLNIIRVIERAQNGLILVVGLGGVKNIQQIGNLSRL